MSEVKVIPPTVGRVVLFVPAHSAHEAGHSLHAGKQHAATVCHVHNDRMVNLSVFDVHGKQFSRTSVQLRQPGDESPDHDYCEWMPYQIGQAAKQS